MLYEIARTKRIKRSYSLLFFLKNKATELHDQKLFKVDSKSTTEMGADSLMIKESILLLCPLENKSCHCTSSKKDKM